MTEEDVGEGAVPDGESADDAVADEVAAELAAVAEAEADELPALRTELQEARDALAAERAARSATATRRLADARYAGQGSTIEVEVQAPIDSNALAALGESFHERHHRVYGHSQPSNPVELVDARIVKSWRPGFGGFVPPWGEAGEESVVAAWFGGKPVETPVVDRAGLVERVGPLIIRQADTTVLVPPGRRVHATDDGNLVLGNV